MIQAKKRYVDDKLAIWIQKGHEGESIQQVLRGEINGLQKEFYGGELVLEPDLSEAGDSVVFCGITIEIMKENFNGSIIPQAVCSPKFKAVTAHASSSGVTRSSLVSGIKARIRQYTTKGAERSEIFKKELKNYCEHLLSQGYGDINIPALRKEIQA